MSRCSLAISATVGRQEIPKFASNRELLPELRPFVNDYKPFICDIAFLSRETIAKFRSDFGQVAKFFVDCREFGREKVEKSMKLEDVRHVQEVIDLLSAFANIPRNSFISDGKGGIEMTSALLGLQEHWTNVGIQQGYQRGIQQEKQSSQLERTQLLKSLLKAGVDESILGDSFSEEEIRLARAMLHS